MDVPKGLYTKLHDMFYFVPGRGAAYCDEYVSLSVCSSVCPLAYLITAWLKLEFHDADTDTDILARILADTSDTRD